MGRILEIDDEQVLLECGEAKLRLNRAAISAVTNKDGKTVEEKK